MTTLNSQQRPINYKNTMNTQKQIMRAMRRLESTCMATMIAPMARKTFWKSTPLM